MCTVVYKTVAAKTVDNFESTATVYPDNCLLLASVCSVNCFDCKILHEA